MPFKKLSYVDPVKLYAAMEEMDMPFVLGSRTKDDKKARYTYVSASPEFVVKIGEEGTLVNGEKYSREKNPFKALKSIKIDRVNGTRFLGGFVGYVAYEAVKNYIGGKIIEPSVFGYYPWTFIYDHMTGDFGMFYIREPPFNPERIVEKAKREKLEMRDEGSHIISEDADQQRFEEMVHQAKEHIFAGDVFQVVISREYRIKSDLNPLEIYTRLVNINPSPYTFLLNFENVVVGASPETMASVESGRVKINPIAGTIPRGKNSKEDEYLRKKLLNDEKEKAEHVMLVDLARNDVRKVSKSGSVRLTRFLDVTRYSHVQHIESEVVGDLELDKSAFDAMEAAFPAGTLTGAPKIRAMEIIDEIEMSPRGIYGGAVGYFSVTGDADLAISIRMATINKEIRVRAGAGIVADSDFKREFMESENKMMPVLKALGVRR